MVLLLVLLSASLKLASGLECESPGDSFPHESNCVNYYFCDSENNPHLFTCPEGHHYNPDLRKCDGSDNFQCISKTGHVNDDDNLKGIYYEDGSIGSSFTGDLKKVIPKFYKSHSKPDYDNADEETRFDEAGEYLPEDYSRRVEKRQTNDDKKDTENEGDNLEESTNNDEHEHEDKTDQTLGSDENVKSDEDHISQEKAVSNEQNDDKNDGGELGDSENKDERGLENKNDEEVANNEDSNFHGKTQDDKNGDDELEKSVNKDKSDHEDVNEKEIESDKTVENHEEQAQEHSVPQGDENIDSESKQENESDETILTSEFKSNSDHKEEIFPTGAFFYPIRYPGFVPLSQDQKDRSSSLIYGYDEAQAEHKTTEDKNASKEESHDVEHHENAGEEGSHDFEHQENTGEKNNKSQAEDGNYEVDGDEHKEGGDTLRNGDEERDTPADNEEEQPEIIKGEDYKDVDLQQDTPVKDEDKQAEDATTEGNNPTDKPKEMQNGEEETGDGHIDEEESEE